MDKATLLYTTIQNLSSRIRSIKEQALRSPAYQDLSLAAIHYLHTIDGMKDPTFVELADRLGYSKPSVTVMVSKLIDRGFVRKTRSREDGRVYYLSLTTAGAEITAAYEAAQAQVVEHITSKLDSDEIDRLIRLLDKIS